MGTTAHYALRFPELTDAPDGATQIENLAGDVDAAMFTATAPEGYAAYTPAVGGGGNANFATRAGWYCQRGKKVHFCAYIVIGGTAGTGSASVTVTAPTSIDRTTRQIVPAEGDGLRGGSGADAVGVARANTSGSGAVWDKILLTSITTTFSGHTELQGSDLTAGGILTIEGVYRST
jgi:hypothetical protein